MCFDAALAVSFSVSAHWAFIVFNIANRAACAGRSLVAAAPLLGCHPNFPATSPALLVAQTLYRPIANIIAVDRIH